MMESSKRILNLAIAFSLVVLSISVMIFSLKDNKAMAAPRLPADSFSPVGTYVLNSRDNQTYICIVGYNAVTRQIKLLSSTDLNHFKMSASK